MALMEWVDQFTVGVQTMDQQHILLMDLINQMDDAVRVSVRNPQIPVILTTLVELTTTHFNDEEKLMQESGFAGLEEHRAVHQKLLRAVTDVMEKVNSGKLSASANLAAFLHFWLEKHLAGYDQIYGQYIADLKTASAAR